MPKFLEIILLIIQILKLLRELRKKGVKAPFGSTEVLAAESRARKSGNLAELKRMKAILESELAKADF